MAAAGKKAEKPAEQKKALYRFENKRTGTVLETVCRISGPDWKQISGPKEKQEKDPEQDPEGTEEEE